MQIERLEDFIANMPKSVSTNTEKKPDGCI